MSNVSQEIVRVIMWFAFLIGMAGLLILGVLSVVNRNQDSQAKKDEPFRMGVDDLWNEDSRYW